MKTNFLRWGLVALVAPLLVSCSKELSETPAPVMEQATAAAKAPSSLVRCPPGLPKTLPGYPDIKCGCSDDTSTSTIGLDKNKQRYIASGATLNFLTSAMMETDNMSTSYSPGDGKVGDRYCAGAAKQNWFMIRSSRNPDFPNGGGGPSQYEDAARLNRDPKLDVRAYLASLSHYGLNDFLAGHRNGSSGIKSPNTNDIKRFRAAFYWTRDRIASNPAYRTNRVRFWVEIPAIYNAQNPVPAEVR